MSVPSSALPHAHRPGTARAALAYPDFRLIWFGLFLSNIGTWMQNFTLPAYIEDRTESAALVGLLVFTQLGPLLLLSIPAGVLADKVPRRPYLITMQAIQGAMSIVLAIFVASDQPLWTLFVASLLIGVANALNAPAFQASVPLMVHRRDLAGAVSLNSVSMNASRVIGPALAALLGVAGLTTAHLFVFNAGTYLFLIAALLAVNMPSAIGNFAERGWRRLLVGVKIARTRRVVSRTLMTMSIFSFACLTFIGLFPSIARRNYGMEPDGGQYKMLYATWGFGACLGALAVGTVLSHVDRRRLVVYGLGGFTVSLAVFALITSPLPAYPVAFVLGFVYFLTATALMTIFQENLADNERAVVMPLWFMAFGGTIPIGNLAFGPVIDLIGARPVMLFGAVVALILARWCDLRRLQPNDFLEPFGPHDGTHAQAEVGPVSSGASAPAGG